MIGKAQKQFKGLPPGNVIAIRFGSEPFPTPDFGDLFRNNINLWQAF